ncbi:hypothetical protein BGW36DRAFT_404156 [Talaromyces proteolyticus]|uniref:Mid2 domain-containing protein n=1 Tax=Talaromyces proteolyticus TaxID=1131652 RepID=A0AAD4Q525_9EURO|nr:uncharacterized protein BGW36DRAFT_404156 [Talaromyces proteolyticus]KAH8703851.1 hypothetical protein BGW36DRAFT_404156 [Talaromyces proteolyticus]
MPTSSTGDMTATAVGALTTTFTPAPSCLRDLYLEVTSIPSEDIPGGYSWVHLGATTSTAACVPSGWAPLVHYSPGICPASYTLGCDASTHTFSGTRTEYRATCCPSGYACRAASDTSLYPWATIDPCTVRQPTSTVAIVTYNTNTTPAATLALSVNDYYEALGVSIRWQPSDPLPVQTGPSAATATTGPPSATETTAPSTSTATTSLSISTTTGLTTSTKPPTTTVDSPGSTETQQSVPASNSSPASQGLSTGAKAGVGIGVAIAGVLIIFVAVFFLYIRPRRNKDKSQSPWNGEKKSELAASAAPASVHASHELGSSALTELGSSALNELEGRPGAARHIVYEMDGLGNVGKK